MGILFLFLLVATEHSIADIYEVPDEDIFDHPFTRDTNNNKEDVNKDTDTDVEVNKIPYNDLLSLLHDEYSNKALLAHISNPQLPKVKDVEKVVKEKRNTTHKSTVKLVRVPINEEFNDVTRFAANDWNRLKRDNIHDKAINDIKDIGNVASDFNRLKRDVDAVDKVTVKRDLDVKDVTTQVTAEDTVNIENIPDEPTVIYDNNTRLRRSAISLLRDLFHRTTTTAKPINKNVVPLYFRNSPDFAANTTDLIGNLIDSIKLLNEHLANLKIHVNENIGFVMIKVPISDLEGMRYIKGMQQDINETKFKNSARSKRDVPENPIEINENGTLQNNTYYNVTKYDNGIIDEKGLIERTIISDSETNQQIDISNEMNKPKRHVNITDTEVIHSTSNDSALNVTEKSVSDIYSKQSDVNETAIESKDIESNISRRVYNEPDILNNRDITDVKPKENTRKYLVNREDLLFFIEKTYAEIKNLIAPIEDVRDRYSATVLYKIGYIIANLDTMDITLNKLRNRLVKNDGDTKRLQKVFKKLSMSKKLVESVMGYLNTFAENQLVIAQ